MYTHINALKMVLEILRKLDGFEVRNFSHSLTFLLATLVCQVEDGRIVAIATDEAEGPGPITWGRSIEKRSDTKEQGEMFASGKMVRIG